MDPFSVQYAIKGMVRVSNIIFKKDRVRVHVAVGCIIILMMIFHDMYCNKQAISNV